MGLAMAVGTKGDASPHSIALLHPHHVVDIKEARIVSSATAIGASLIFFWPSLNLAGFRLRPWSH